MKAIRVGPQVYLRADALVGRIRELADGYTTTGGCTGDGDLLDAIVCRSISDTLHELANALEASIAAAQCRPDQAGTK